MQTFFVMLRYLSLQFLHHFRVPDQQETTCIVSYVRDWCSSSTHKVQERRQAVVSLPAAKMLMI